jgi:hypothetical protein
VRKIQAGDVSEEDFLNELMSLSLSPQDRDAVDVVPARVKSRKVDAKILPPDDGLLKRRVLWHTSDEKLRHRGQMYKGFDAVIRNYFDPRMGRKKNVVTFPLGYLSGFVGEPRVGSEPRKNLWAFCGAGYKKRQAMLECFTDVPRGFVHLAQGWVEGSGALSQDALAAVYAETEFVLCPAGVNHFDTFRLMEALQAGAIPVIITFLGRDYAKYTFGRHPFVVAKNWSEAAQILRHFEDHPEQLAKKRKAVNDWYATYRKELIDSFRRIVTTGVPTGREWEVVKFQRRAAWDIPLLIRVSRRFHPAYKKNQSAKKSKP